MDKVITVRRSFLNEIRAFCNRFATMCNGCFKRYCDCSLFDEIHKAKNFIIIIDNLRDAEEEKFYIENPYEELCDKIITAIRQAKGKPISADQIKIPGVYKQRKSWTIKSMLKNGRIEVTFEHGKPFYVVCENDTRNNKHNIKKETHHGVWHEFNQHQGGA